MEYQLVLQFPATSLDDYDTFIALEENLRQQIGALGEVDGHDFGSGEMNIFIITSNPIKTFDYLKPIIVNRDLMTILKAAYRKMEEQEFQIIWPAQLKEFRVI